MPILAQQFDSGNRICGRILSRHPSNAPRLRVDIGKRQRLADGGQRAERQHERDSRIRGRRECRRRTGRTCVDRRAELCGDAGRCTRTDFSSIADANSLTSTDASTAVKSSSGAVACTESVAFTVAAITCASSSTESVAGTITQSGSVRPVT